MFSNISSILALVATVKLSLGVQTSKTRAVEQLKVSPDLFP